MWENLAFSTSQEDGGRCVEMACRPLLPRMGAVEGGSRFLWLTRSLCHSTTHSAVVRRCSHAYCSVRSRFTLKFSIWQRRSLRFISFHEASRGPPHSGPAYHPIPPIWHSAHTPVQ